MSDISSNGHPDPEPIPPRIAPPEGVRAARGEVPSQNDEEDEAPALSVAEAPSIEDSYGDSYANPYEAPPGFDVEDEFSSPVNKSLRPDTPKDVELGLMEHLGELRQRLLYCAMILMVGMAFTWSYSEALQGWFAAPIQRVIEGRGTLQSTNPAGFFLITFQFTMVSALILTAPLLFWQVWRFIEPALTLSERRYSLIIVPFASVLFFLGAGLGYAVSPLFFKFFMSFQMPGVAANWDYTTQHHLRQWPTHASRVVSRSSFEVTAVNNPLLPTYT
jgi:sec-independent protein translocase protein TatC